MVIESIASWILGIKCQSCPLLLKIIGKNNKTISEKLEFSRNIPVFDEIDFLFFKLINDYFTVEIRHFHQIFIYAITRHEIIFKIFWI